MSFEFKVYLVDDDAAVRKGLERSLQHHGYKVKAYSSGEDFLAQIESTDYGCIILDVAMVGMSGLEVQSELISRDHNIPIIFMTGHGDVPTSVRAIKHGAIEFLEKPFDVDLLLAKVEEAIKLDEQRFTKVQSNADLLERFRTLTKREVEVMAGLVAGRADKSNKEIAQDIGISHRTVEEYRARIMHKMKASSITHLVEIAKACDIYKNEN